MQSYKLIRRTFAIGWILILVNASVGHAATVSWWRFEEDTIEPDPNSGIIFSNPNEVASEPAMTSENALVSNDNPNLDLFAPVVPRVGAANTGSVRSDDNGSGNDGIFGSAAYSSTLDVDSITVEFWARTTENEAGFVARTTDSNDAGEDNSLQDGFRIIDPQNVTVQFWTSNPGGGNRNLTTLSTGVAINAAGSSGFGEWYYIAFRYNATGKTADLFINDQQFTTTAIGNGNNRPLWWGGNNAQPAVHIGYKMDGNPNNSIGTLDEIRFSDLALPDDDLLTAAPIPEAETILTFTLLTAIAACFEWRRRAVGKREYH